MVGIACDFLAGNPSNPAESRKHALDSIWGLVKGRGQQRKRDTAALHGPYATIEKTIKTNNIQPEATCELH